MNKLICNGAISNFFFLTVVTKLIYKNIGQRIGSTPIFVHHCGIIIVCLSQCLLVHHDLKTMISLVSFLFFGHLIMRLGHMIKRDTGVYANL